MALPKVIVIYFSSCAFFLFISLATHSLASSTDGPSLSRGGETRIEREALLIILAMTLATLFIGFSVLMAVCFGCFGGRNPWQLDTIIVADELEKQPESKLPKKKKMKGGDREERMIEIWEASKTGVVRKLRWENVEMLTNNFASVIGQGGFSTVYLAHLHVGSVRFMGALKILSNSERLKRVFRQELDVLLRVHHENIVKLFAYCDEKEEGVLLFEMVPNGNLHEKLHESEGKEALSWQQRVTIAFGVARAIEYLHERCEIPIVHCDVKASNVLLDHGFVPKLCDFGFARAGTSSSAILPSSSVMGSPGYVDPHYLRTGIVSNKNDVYSFGVLLLELLTGVEAFSAEKEQLLTCFAAGVISDPSTAPHFIDARLAGKFEADEARGIASIAVSCLNDQPALRPSMTDVLSLLAKNVAGSVKREAVER